MCLWTCLFTVSSLYNRVSVIDDWMSTESWWNVTDWRNRRSRWGKGTVPLPLCPPQIPRGLLRWYAGDWPTEPWRGSPAGCFLPQPFAFIIRTTMWAVCAADCGYLSTRRQHLHSCPRLWSSYELLDIKCLTMVSLMMVCTAPKHVGRMW